MASTLIGRLQLVVQAMGMGEARKVENSIRGIEAAAKRLSSASWGRNFQGQIEKLALSSQQIETVRRSWNRLEKDMSSRGLSKALQKSEIAAWKTSTLGHLAQVRSSMRSTEAEARRIGKSMQKALRPLMIMGGGYTGAYIGGIAGREALIAASEGRRVQAEAKYSGLSEGERGKINTRADDLSNKYRLSRSQIFEVIKEASLSMPSTDAALAVSEEMARAFLVLSNMTDTESAIGGLRAFNKAMDNIEKVTPQEYTFFLENFMKAQQVAGKDIDLDAYAQALKYARSSGKVYGDDFLSKWLPFLIAETGGSDAGGQIRAAFDQFIVGRASNKAVKAQEQYGVRGADGQLIGGDKTFTTNPIKWVKEHLIPQLQKSGVDMTDETAIAKVLGEITNNRLSSDLLSRIVFSFDQYRRLVEERMPNAAGLNAADQVQKDNPFAAWQGFKDSMKNLSDAMLPMEQVNSGLNTFADTINRFQQSVREGDPRVSKGLAVTAAAGGAFATWKVASGIWGLITAGAALNSAAAALTAAAVAQGGSDVLGGAAGKGRDLAGLIRDPRAWLAAAAAAGLWKVIADTTASNGKDNRGPAPKVHSQGVAEDAANNYRMYHGIPFEGGWHKVGLGAIPAPGNPNDLPADGVTKKADEMKSALSVTGKPTVDTSSIDAAIAKARQLLSVLQSAGSAANTASSGVDKELRRSYSDFGVAP